MNEIAEAKPKAGVSVTVLLPLAPLAIVTELGLSDKLKAGVPTITLIAAEVEPAKLVSPP